MKGNGDDMQLLGAEARENMKKVSAHIVRDSFGMTFDPKRGDLWTTANGGRAFDEVTRVRAGFARSSRIPDSAGRTSSRQRASASSMATDSARSTTAT